ncbi:MAG: molybdopterin-guanine dinucleotide biosynthesis protein B [bacterium]|nr:molybdopterin-guanine dinucleotide biosynthesis protein B [bacterium]
MRKMISLEEAEALIIENTVSVQTTEEVELTRALDRIAARDYQAVTDQPPFDRSPLDGYALCSADIVTASREQPVELSVIETIYAGDIPKQTVERGQAVRIMTGAMLPKGADCVIRQEDTEAVQESKCRIFACVKSQQNICRQGEDIRKGSVIIRQGTVMTPAHGAVLAGQGFFRVKVYARIRIAVLTTGTELISDIDESPESNREPEQEMQGKIYDSNGSMLALRLTELGMDADIFHISDEKHLIQEKIQELTADYDAIITTGGVSVGEKDYIPEVMKQLGAKVLFHGVDIKPGTPMLSAVYQNKLVFCLSGNPFAAIATFELLAVSGLLKMTGLHNFKHHQFNAILLNDFPKQTIDRRRFIRAQHMEDGIRIPDNHSSGSLYSMIGCNCMIDIPAESGPLKAGTVVQAVELFDLRRLQERQGVDVPVICICGRKNAGKTTFIEGLLPFLLNEKLRVGVIKHDGHDFIPDVPGTDSARMHAAGAGTTAIYSDRRQAYYIEQEESQFEMVKNRLLTLQKQPLDLILVEGLKNSDYDKIEIMRQAVSKETVVHGGRLLAVCADFTADLEQKLPHFGLTEYEQAARWMKRYITEEL